jgi:hypothetical protein
MVDTDKMFARSAGMIANIATNPVPIASGMGRWLDYCDEVAPECKSMWDRLRNLEYDSDAENLTNWLSRLLRREPPPENVNGLWFGLYNPILEDGKPSCQMYVSGSSGFDPGSSLNEWACDISWFPEGRYSPSEVLKELYRRVDSITENRVGYLGESFLCHGYLALVVSQWCNGPIRASLLGNAPVRAVVIGHDSGDAHRMAVLRAK